MVPARPTPPTLHASRGLFPSPPIGGTIFPRLCLLERHPRVPDNHLGPARRSATRTAEIRIMDAYIFSEPVSLASLRALGCNERWQTSFASYLASIDSATCEPGRVLAGKREQLRVGTARRCDVTRGH